MDAQTKRRLAIQHFHEGRYLFEAYSREANALAIDHFRRATELDATFADARSWYAYAVAEDGRQKWADNPEATLKEALRLIEEAANDAPEHFYTRWTVASIKMLSPDFAGAWEDYEKAEALMRKDLDPALRAEFLAERSEYISCRGDDGDADQAIEDIETAKALAPDECKHWWHWLLAFAYYQKQNYATASGLFQSVSYVGNGISNITYILFAICEARLGRPIPREEVIARLRVKHAGWTPEKIERLPFQKNADLDRFQEGLELAKLIP